MLRCGCDLKSIVPYQKALGSFRKMIPRHGHHLCCECHRGKYTPFLWFLWEDKRTRGADYENNLGNEGGRRRPRPARSLVKSGSARTECRSREGGGKSGSLVAKSRPRGGDSERGRRERVGRTDGRLCMHCIRGKGRPSDRPTEGDPATIPLAAA